MGSMISILGMGLAVLLASCGSCRPGFGACETQSQAELNSTAYSTTPPTVGQFGGYCPPYCAELQSNSYAYYTECSTLCGTGTSSAVGSVSTGTTSNTGTTSSSGTITTSGNGTF